MNNDKVNQAAKEAGIHLYVMPTGSYYTANQENLAKFAELIQSQSEPVYQAKFKPYGWADIKKEEYDLATTTEKRILFTHPPLSVNEQEVIDAANDVLDKAYCDCPNSTRFEKGEHYSSCPLFDLNIAVRKLAIANKKGGK